MTRFALAGLALLIGVARLGAELFKRLGLPAVIGELGAGILLGPSVFGPVAPERCVTLTYERLR